MNRFSKSSDKIACSPHFDRAMSDGVLRQNAYEERLLSTRTRHIEREERFALETIAFHQNQFIRRHVNILERQRSLLQDSSTLMAPGLLPRLVASKQADGMRAVSRSWTSTPAANRIRSGMDAFGRFGSRSGSERGGLVSGHDKEPPGENMNDILNGYRTPGFQRRSALSRGVGSCQREARTASRSGSKTVLANMVHFDHGSGELQSVKGLVRSAPLCADNNTEEMTEFSDVKRSPTDQPRATNASSIFAKEFKSRQNFENFANEADTLVKSCLKASKGNRNAMARSKVQFKDDECLSSLKTKQREQANRIRVERTVLLVCNSVWNTRNKRILCA